MLSSPISHVTVPWQGESKEARGQEFEQESLSQDGEVRRTEVPPLVSAACSVSEEEEKTETLTISEIVLPRA